MARRLPKLVVLDLDMCTWSPETYMLSRVPTRRDIVRGKLHGDAGEGVTGVRCGASSEALSLFPGAVECIRRVYTNELPGVRLALASSADNSKATKIAHAALDLLEVLPGVTVREAIDAGWDDGMTGHIQIGRSPPLSSSKVRTHFPLIHRATGIAFSDMLYFDDCNWDDHVAEVGRQLGVAGIRTPNGMQVHEWEAGLELFHTRAALSEAAADGNTKAGD